MSVGNLKPKQVHGQTLKTGKLWRNYYSKNRIIVNQLQD